MSQKNDFGMSLWQNAEHDSRDDIFFTDYFQVPDITLCDPYSSSFCSESSYFQENDDNNSEDWLSQMMTQTLLDISDLDKVESARPQKVNNA